MAATATDQLDDREVTCASVRHLGHALDDEARRAQRLGGARRREQSETELGQLRGNGHEGLLVGAPDGEERRSLVGSGRPAARSALANAVGRSSALAITSPVERISGPSTGSEPGKRANGRTAAFTLTWTGPSLRSEVELVQAGAGRESSRRVDQVDTGRLGRERHRPRRPRVRLEHVELPVHQRELDVQQPDDAESRAEPPDDAADVAVRLVVQRRRREDARGVARVDSRLLDVLHHRADVHGDAVAERIDVDLERAFEEAVDQDLAGDSLHRPRTCAAS